ncbi:MAG: LPXTG cell wall anchor domain-containing protein [Ruminococcus sp.]|nr:LPXTG cell wall anchor domain-containing protein [Ruminococcus sp.]
MDADTGLEVDVKSGLPTVEKKVKENTKTVEYDTEGLGTETIVGEDYNDVADYSIGDSIEFELIGSLPENFFDYDTYYYQFIDTMCKGLTLDIAGGSSTSLDTGDFTIYVGDTTNGRGTTVINTNCYTVTDNSGSGFIITFGDLTDIEDTNGDDITLNADSLIYVIYTAYLNEDAVIGLDGNENEVYLIYSNNPNSGGKDDHGQTPEDKNIVFTYELDTTKIDVNTQEGLEGAEFKLYYEESSTKYYVQVDSSNKVTDWTTDETDASVLTSGTDGLFKVIGLDDGTYYLEETKAPTGYNLLSEAVKVMISATTKNNQQWTTTVDAALTNLSVTVADNEPGTASASTGIVEITVVNKSGSTIPETGGIGTTIFYVVGSVLVAGAGVLLITKKRAKSAQ